MRRSLVSALPVLACLASPSACAKERPAKQPEKHSEKRPEQGSENRPAKQPSPTPTSRQAPTMTSDLDTFLGLRTVRKSDFITRYSIRPESVREGAAYEGLRDVTEIHQKDTSPARFFFRGDKLVMIYLGDPGALQAYSEDALVQRLGGAKQAVELRSRAGKTSNQYLFPRQGVAFSAGEDVEFLEVFPPMTESEYRQTIYREPGPFIK